MEARRRWPPREKHSLLASMWVSFTKFLLAKQHVTEPRGTKTHFTQEDVAEKSRIWGQYFIMPQAGTITVLI